MRLKLKKYFQEMKNKKEILEEDFEAMLSDAIEDLSKTGLSNDEIFKIVKDQFGLNYAHKLCSNLSDLI